MKNTQTKGMGGRKCPCRLARLWVADVCREHGPRQLGGHAQVCHLLQYLAHVCMEISCMKEGDILHERRGYLAWGGESAPPQHLSSAHPPTPLPLALLGAGAQTLPRHSAGQPTQLYDTPAVPRSTPATPSNPRRKLPPPRTRQLRLQLRCRALVLEALAQGRDAAPQL